MTADTTNPILPTPHPDESGSSDAEARKPRAHDRNAAGGSKPLIGTGSSDELSVMLSGAALDPYLDPIQGVDPPPADAQSAPTEPARAEPGSPIPSAPSTSSAELATFDIHGQPSPEAPDPAGGSFDAIVIPPGPRTDAGVHPASQAVTPRAGDFGGVPAQAAPESPADSFANLDLSDRPPAQQVPSSDDEFDQDYDDDSSRSASSWLLLLIASYASAVTIGLVWVLYTHRAPRESDDADVLPAAAAKADPGRRADNSRKLTPPAPLATDKITSFGKPLRLGGLEVTADAITSGPVELRRTISPEEDRDGGVNALKLHLRLRNLSKDSVFAPLDEAFVREREPATFDSFIERGDGQQIDMYPLSVFSEWGIVGQKFKELKPGATLRTQVVSAADALERKTTRMTWRVRVRTGIDQTDEFGVAFTDSDIKPEP